MSTMTQKQQKAAAKAFAERWQGRGYEKGESQTFWIELLHDVLGVEHPTSIISFEGRVRLHNTSFIDAYIAPTKVLIEQKSIHRDLRAPIRQSDGSMLTPFAQAKRYAAELPLSQHPRWVVCCNFAAMLIYDMEQPQGEPEEIRLSELPREVHRLRFLVDATSEILQREVEVSIKAGELVGRLYEAFYAQYAEYRTPTAQDLHALNVLCVRLVFCLYAEDAGVFDKDQFYHYLRSFQPSNMSLALERLFEVLDTPVEQRSPFLDERLKAFPYVNGGLFRRQVGEAIPPISVTVADILLRQVSLSFDWNQISPTIFGAVFESTLNPETRRKGGMHYTSIDNIHRIIDPLLLDELESEFVRLRAIPDVRRRKKGLADLQQHMASLTFFDPACGSGNFLTETYISLRRLENRIIAELSDGERYIGFDDAASNPIRVSIQQFYGIEINDFAVTVATTALWIAEAQMMAETERIVRMEGNFLPLKPYTNIRHANALRTEWGEVIAPSRLDYIIGNPPFVGARLMEAEQKADVTAIFGKDWQNVGNLDYVTCWYMKATTMMEQAWAQGKTVRAALVSTNSISQGEQVADLWTPLIERGVHIDFAWRTFRWDSESHLKAHVHCVIIGFSVAPNKQPRRIYREGSAPQVASYINAYLVDGPDIYVSNRKQPLCDVPSIGIGNQPIDGGQYLFTAEEKDAFLRREPAAAPYFHPFYGADEFINSRERYCLYLGACSPAQLRAMPLCMERVEKVRALRLASKRASTRKCADTPTHFFIENMPKGHSLVIPETSSQRRAYIPIGYMDEGVICSNAVRLVPSATLYHFGVLTSSVHMAWMRIIGGRLKSDYRYSIGLVYNNFPWPTALSSAQQAKIEETAQGILDARALYPDSSLADLYDEVTMPLELRRAHQQNDRAVAAAYGLDYAADESDTVAHLLTLYSRLA